MSGNLSKDAAELVREGRRALRPSGADKARVFAALQNRMLVGETPTSDTNPTPMVGETAVGAKTMAKLAALTAGVVAAGVAFVMYATSDPEEQQGQAVPPVATRTDPAADTATNTATNTSAPTSNPISPTSDVEVVEDSGALQRTASSPASPRPSAQGADSDRLAEEVALLTRAQKHFHAGNLPGALAAADEHRRKFPRGVLAQERSNLRVRTLCGMGRDREAQTENNRLKRLAPGDVGSDDVCRRGK